METEVTSSPTVISPSTPHTTTSSTGQANLAAKQVDGSRKSSSTTPAFLSNLGRATLRGIRKCPHCGVFNGTRGLSCKNKACGVSLRNATSVSKKCAVEVVKVIIDSEERGGKEREGGGGGVQVFSVCHRGRGATATQLGFVELVPTDTAIATGDGTTLLTRINLGRCFLPSCRQRSNQGESESAVASSKQSSDSLCVHIKQAIECRSCATPLTLKSSVLEGLQASIQAREELWRLATESPGPLVQRVSKDTLVVKCHTDSQHPLGLLHLTVGAGGLSEVSKSERRSREQQNSVFHCACLVNNGGGGGRRSKASVVDGAAHPPPSSLTSQPCLHFYACVCAFASDEKLASEFAAFINYTPNGVQQNASTNRVISPGEKPLQQAESVNSHHKTKKPRLDESLSVASPSGAGIEGVSASGLRRAAQRKAPGAGGLKAPGSTQVVDERTVTMGFHQWLASVTERIHQTMHYQFDAGGSGRGYLNSVVFLHQGNLSLWCTTSLRSSSTLCQHRLSLGSKKKRLPNFTTAFVRNDGLPVGSFSKYTWHITNLMQVKRIFDTPEVPLELFQSFVKNVDGSFSRFRCPEPLPEPELPEGYKTDRPQAIRPMELRTFLKVGPGSADQKEASPFVIEWIPDVLPRCQMGELRISFEFGHQQSGQPEYSEKTGAAEKGGRNKTDSSQPKLTKTVEILQVVV
ncbi:protein C2orf42 [Nibea albiflora]|uniref:Protein C2orf42 n=1 Tax=Nibea albiflora TaxID=240163 RepID=A0ACB7F8N7_NIBAL|nr:protein C2orf42 [Nibea albiflora]